MKNKKEKAPKQIVMLQALCNNERGWAKVMSQFGRVSLAQVEGFRFTEHIEVWENGVCVSSTLPKQCLRLGWLDEMTFGLVLCLTTLRRGWPVIRQQQADVIIACANSMAMAALFFRFIGKTQKVVCLVSDYFPPHGSLAVQIYRRIGDLLTRGLCRLADEAWALSPRIPTVKANPRNFLVPLYINDEAVPLGPRAEIIYIGMPSPDHALEILFDICRRHRIRLNLVGTSAYLESIRHLAPADTVFHGFISDPPRIREICSRCFCGYAVYRKIGPQNYSYYGVPSKTLNYLASNTPVITTNIADFSQNIEKFGLGHVVQPEAGEIERAVLDLQNRPSKFHEAINRFRNGWNVGVEKFYHERLADLSGT